MSSSDVPDVVESFNGSQLGVTVAAWLRLLTRREYRAAACHWATPSSTLMPVRPELVTLTKATTARAMTKMRALATRRNAA